MVMRERFNALVSVFIFVLSLYKGLSFGAGNDSSTIRSIEKERQALVNFKESLIDNYGRLSSWGNEAAQNDCCKWIGVHCSNRTGRVVSLDLHQPQLLNQPLRGNISSSLLELPDLNYLDLSFNDFGGSPIPAFIGSLSSLQSLNLASAGFSGEIPRNEISNLTNLWSLFLGDNTNLSVENLDWLSRLSLLRKLDLSHIHIISNVNWLQSLGKLPFLKELYLSNCGLSETIASLPLFNSSLTSLSVIDFSSNQLTGSFPDLSSFRSLRELYLSDNKLQGQLPLTIGQLSALEVLHVASNSIQGTVSEGHIANLSKLKELDLSLNSLAFEFSSDWIPLFQLDVIKLEGCKLGPRFPEWLQTQNNFSQLHMPSAGISDSVPSWFWDLSKNLRYLNLSTNQITGVLPNLSMKFAEFPSLDLSINLLEGPLPLFPPNITELYLNQNKFTGSISSLCANFIALDLSENQLSGEIPDCWKHMMEGLIILNLAINKFSGKIPSSLGYLKQLETLHLCKNNFTGELPDSMKNLRSLKILDVGENKLSGPIPEWIGTNMKEVRVFSLRVNEFSGSIPTNLCNLNEVQIFDISQNNISGNIPRCFNRFTSLAERKASVQSTAFNYSGGINHGQQEFMGGVLVQWKGRVTEYRKTLGLVKSIDLSSNKLVGQVPIELASLRQLASLNLSRNSLTENIFENIGQMEMLESLDLSRNQLSGKVPAGMGRLNYLSVLDLSDNNLSGRIPSSTQLQGFNASVYANNLQLCGLPLPYTCPGDDRARGSPLDGQGQDDGSGEDEDKLITLGFFVSMILGFAFGFWGVFGTILLKTAWGVAYFRFLNEAKDWVYVRAKINMARLRNKLKG